ncbi:BRE1-domain-containing protein [Ceraceosorus guamensis]|uniref:E3 ubiquitin protein ligase n=1 Tax=Ceraceosorus guamensis TaxID=1522189 RepID=A0A316W8M7_9BASI|nr:BRE1-domain-containing protein [Ceraceosorus guamensis]PWN46270.1 BRE1-domain-containing protein [Ceraceosorus guamensis]
MHQALKRPLSALDGSSSEDATSTKRPTLTSKHSSNGVADIPLATDAEEDEPAYKGLEAFRKEAIYRRLLEARRDLGRAEQRAASLTQSWEHSQRIAQDWQLLWTLLVEDLTKFQPSAEEWGPEREVLLPPTDHNQLAPVQVRCDAVHSVLKRIAARDPQNGIEAASISSRADALAAESAQLRVQLTSALLEGKRLSTQLSELQLSLQRAEKRADRLASLTVRRVERPNWEEEERRRQAAEDAQARAEADRVAAEAQHHQDNQVVPNGLPGVISQHELDAEREAHSAEVSEALAEAMMRLDEADKLRTELTSTRETAEELRAELERVPDERVLASVLYRDLHSHFTTASEEAERLGKSLATVEAENLTLREQLLDQSTSSNDAASAQIDELQTLLKGNEADVARLRGQRDDLQAELTERRQRDGVKSSQHEEMKELLNAREARIQTLRSEVRRVHMIIAARAGDTEAFQKAKAREASDEDDVALIEELQGRLKAAEQTSADLRRQLEARSSSTTEEEMLVRASALQGELDALRSLLDGAGDGDVVKRKLEEQERATTSIRLELDASSEATKALCDEVDRLSAAFADAEKLAAKNVHDVAKLEDKMLRLTTEKSKADNKYFAAMRAKDALDNERRTALRTAERQTKALERYAEAEKVLSAQLVAAEKEAAVRKRAMEDQTTKLIEADREARLLRVREQDALKAKQHAEARLAALFPQQAEDARSAARELEQRQRLERQLERAQREKAEALAAAAAAAAATGTNRGRRSSTADTGMQVDYLNSLLRCSACNDRYRNTILVKCLHTFCEECVNARVQTRQRKCPHCAAAFATSDVQPLYLQ